MSQIMKRIFGKQRKYCKNLNKKLVKYAKNLSKITEKYRKLGIDWSVIWIKSLNIYKNGVKIWKEKMYAENWLKMNWNMQKVVKNHPKSGKKLTKNGWKQQQFDHKQDVKKIPKQFT